MKCCLPLIAIVMLFFSTSAFSQAKQGKADKMRLAILDLQPKGVSKVLASSISDFLRTEMVETNRFTVVERNQMDSILKEQGFQQTGCTDSACAVQMGKVLSANKILIGEVSSIGTGIMITSRVVDVEKGVAEFASSEKANDLNDIDRAAKALAGKLTDRITGKRVAGGEVTIENLDIKNNIVYRAARVRWGLVYGLIQDEDIETYFPGGFGFNILIDLYLYRARDNKGNGFDFFLRGRFTNSELDMNKIDEYSRISKIGIVPVGDTLDGKQVKDNNDLGLNTGTWNGTAFNFGARYIYGWYYSDTLWQVYGFLAYQLMFAGAEIVVNYELTPLEMKEVTYTEEYTSPFGIIGGMGIEICPWAYGAVFIELTYGYSPVDMWGKTRNIDGLKLNFGFAYRSTFL